VIYWVECSTMCLLCAKIYLKGYLGGKIYSAVGENKFRLLLDGKWITVFTNAAIRVLY
jgi:hypothetical protein